MLDIKFIRQNPEVVKKNCALRGVKVDVDALLALDVTRRELMQKAEELRAQRNQKSQGKPTAEEIEKLRQVGDDIVALEAKLAEVEAQYYQILLSIPNLTHPDVPAGGEEDFKILETHGKAPTFDFTPKDHEELLVDLGLLDFERGAKVAGAKFYFAKGALARLNQALINYGIDVVTKRGYELMETPDLAKGEILSGIGFNPRGPEAQVYQVSHELGDTDLNLIATAEITVGGYHKDEILDLSKGPKKYVALSHCFRTEAGAYGRTSKGLYRVHQFTKLEMFVFCKPEDSEAMHQELLSIEKELIDGLEIPYQVIDVATGDLGGPAYRKYDLEAWMVMRNPPAGGGYGEITSTSNCTDYQARRLNIRYRNDQNETEFVHTLNGTAIVTSRLPIAIAENYQTAEGTIKVPEVLQKYMSGLKEIKSQE